MKFVQDRKRERGSVVCVATLGSLVITLVCEFMRGRGDGDCLCVWSEGFFFWV